MIFTCPSVTQEILRTMAQRVELVQTVLQEQAKLISLGTLATELAHELNNPAAAVSQIGHSLYTSITSITAFFGTVSMFFLLCGHG
jgi:signal transduction histidine kinase